MRIENKVLRKFLECVNINSEVEDVILNFESEGMSVQSMTESNVGMVIAKLSKNAFLNYESLGKIPLSNLSKFIKFLTLFDEIIEIKKQENCLNVVSDSKSGEYVLTSEEYLEKETRIPEIEYKNVLKIDSSLLNDVCKSSGILGDKLPVISFFIKNGELVVESGELHKIRQTIKVEKVEDCNAKFGELLHKCVNLLEGEITIKLATNMPITLEQKKENFRITYIIAPRVEE